MGLLMLGLSHRSAPVEVREALALDASLGAAYESLKGGPVEELLLLSTCNRVEAYAVASDSAEAEARLRSYFEGRAGQRGPQARKALQAKFEALFKAQGK